MPELFIPQPEQWLNSNHRTHWAVRSKRTKAWRKTAGLVALAADLGTRDHIHVTAWIHKETRRRYDAANLHPTVKACIDGCVDAGVIPDDDNAHLTGPDLRMGEARPDQPGVTLTITERSTS